MREKRGKNEEKMRGRLLLPSKNELTLHVK
jgi:hypothetical protein